MKKINIAIAFMIVLSFIIAAYAYNSIPEDKVASHWNFEGEVNGYMPKFWGLFLMPIISLALLLLFLVIPRIDPLKKNIEKFRKYYDSLILVILLFFFYIFLLTILANFGYNFNMNYALIPALGFLFILIGYFMKKMKRNWFMGIRTPWTISNDEVWKKTHDLGSILFILAGIAVFIGIFFQDYLWLFILLPILIAAIVPVVYSYIIYRKIKK
ncbi:hypothetical protein A3K73_08455 [Candidatus Pacearchaeota archaeon RBG_13_36_9]|nr:MAG: hypothetical protein A3K73_08455 [Candidatus Pacearchaeota archaeon RBG_13_36_9]